MVLILGDNLFFGSKFNDLVVNAVSENNGATIFVKKFLTLIGLVLLSMIKILKYYLLKKNQKNPKSEFAVTGLYIYDKDSYTMQKHLKNLKEGSLK